MVGQDEYVSTHIFQFSVEDVANECDLSVVSEVYCKFVKFPCIDQLMRALSPASPGSDVFLATP
jgi:hypothetical protein